MGSPSLIILLIVVVWVIVLAPLAFGNNKPIRRSGEGFEETRVLHEGGTVPVVARRRPKLTAADVHHHESSDEDYEVVEAVPEEEQVLVDDTSGNLKTLITRHTGVSRKVVPKVIEAEDVEEEATTTATVGGSTAYSVLQAQEEQEDEEEQDHSETYEVEESYLAPADFGYTSDDAEAAELPAVESEEGEDAVSSAESSVELEDEDIAFAEARKGRGGYDPQRDARTRADRLKRRKITLISLLSASAITLIIAFIVGGWTWALPAIAVALTLWFLVALRRVVKQEQALRARRQRQLRRARLGVDTQERPAVLERERRRAGAVIMDLDDESPDFEHLPRYRAPQQPRVPVPAGGAYGDFEEYDDYDDYGAYGDRAS